MGRAAGAGGEIALDEEEEATPFDWPEDDECEGRCGDGATGERPAPLLTDDLVIAAAERRGEPALPEATVEAALTLALPTETARFDLIRLPAPPARVPDDALEERTRRLLAEFARRGHRVFWFSPVPREGSEEDAADDGAAVPASGFAVGSLIPLPPPDEEGGADEDGALLAALAAARDAHGIEAAVLWLPGPGWAGAAVRARERWGWRIVYDPGAAAGGGPLDGAAAAADGGLRRAADVVLAPPAEAPAGPRAGWLDLAGVSSWPERWGALDPAVRGAFPKASVIVVTFDNLAFSRLCVASLLANTEYPNWELIVVDNGSTDGTPEFLRGVAGRHRNVRLVFNEENRGFGPANNQGLAIAEGEILVLLNNDTLVPGGWLSRLATHLADPRLGLVGPASNRTCNEAQVAAPYETYGGMRRFAQERARQHDGDLVPIRMLAMYCTAFRRDVLRRVGFLDERYVQGMFEDEDYALRVKEAGYGVAWAPDAYVHHAYHASIGKLLPSGEYIALFRANQARFEEKWGICWERHRPRP